MVDFLNLKEAWQSTSGEGVTVGILDSGVDADHPDIKNNVAEGKSFSGKTEDGLEDPVGHGTATASLIAGHGHAKDGDSGIIGIAPKAKILSAEIQLDDPEDFDHGSLASGIRWLADNGADIIAIGSGHVGEKKSEHEAIKYAAIERGIPIVAAIGNVGEGQGPTGEDVPRTETTYPAGYEEVIGVSAINQSGKLDDVSMYGEEVAVAAPGSRDVIAAKPGGGADNFGGTSAAQAITAGVLALLKAKYPDESRMELIWRLTELTTKAGNKEEDWNDKYGFGIVNPVKALTEDPGPLPEDLKDPEPTGTYPDDKASSTSDAAAANNSESGSTTALIVAITAVIAIAAAVTLIILIRRMKRHSRRANESVVYPHLLQPQQDTTASHSSELKPPAPPSAPNL